MDLATFVKVVQGISTKLKILGKNQINVNLNANRANAIINTVAKSPYCQSTNRFTFNAPPTTVTATTASLFSTATGTHAGPIDVSAAS